MVVLPIPNHAEQWVNGRTIEQLKVGFMAREDEIEPAMLRAIDRIADLRAGYENLPPPIDGAAQAAELVIDLIKKRNVGRV